MRNILLLCFVLFISGSYGQEYKFGIGGRAGSSVGLSVKGFVLANDDNYIALEAIGAKRYGGYNFTALCEYQKEIHLKGMRYAALYAYAGIGPHFGSYDISSGYKNRKNELYTESVFNVGADVALGLEYVFADFPLTVGADFRPYYDIINPGPHYFDAGITLRFAIK